MFEARKCREANEAACGALQLAAIQKCHCRSAPESYKVPATSATPATCSESTFRGNFRMRYALTCLQEGL